MKPLNYAKWFRFFWVCKGVVTRVASSGSYDRFGILFLFALSLLLMLRQFASPSYFTVVVDDAFIYPSWAWQFKEALKEGVFYPRWLPLNFWGYGSPTFLLYPPLAYYLVAMVNLFTDSVITAMNVVKFAALFLSGVGIYFLVKEFYPARAALFSAVFSVTLPYNILLMYVFGSFAAMVSCLWFSPVLLFMYRFFKTGRHGYLIVSGVCYGGLVLTHLVNAYMFAFVITFYVIYMTVVTGKAGNIVALPTVLLTGLSLSAAYILPVIFERKYVNLDIFTTGAKGYVYSNMFILPDMTARFKPAGDFWPVYYNTMVLLTITFSIFIWACLLRSMKYRGAGGAGPAGSINTFFLTTAVCSILLMFGVSSFLWEVIPFFKYILFPTRWLDIIAFSAACLSATLVAAPSSNNIKIKQLILPVALLSACLAWDFYCITGAPVHNKSAPFQAMAVNTIMEHLPNEARIDHLQKETDVDSKLGVTVHGKGKADLVAWKSEERIIDVRAETPLFLRLRTFNFPGWTAYVDGERREITTETATGAMLVNIPAGMHRIRLVFRDTPVRFFGKLISIATAMALIGILSAKKIRLRKGVTT